MWIVEMAKEMATVSIVHGRNEGGQRDFFAHDPGYDKVRMVQSAMERDRQSQPRLGPVFGHIFWLA
ncbi:MAG: hypothetical protein O3A47_10175 [Chloroflexi bacterium]|nr:hypothetical protein [Chloroflexota bacterium]